MKKYLLGLLIVPIGIISYTNASSLTITSSDYGYNQDSYTLPNDICEGTVSVSNYECDNDWCSMGIQGLYSNLNLSIYYDGENIGIDCNNDGDTEGSTVVDIYGEQDDFGNGEGLFSSITINYTTPSTEEEGGNTGGGNEGGNTGGIIAGGTEAFSGIISKLGSIFGEFGPYIIYIAIACLGISLLFKALKSLLGFTSGKAKNSIGGREGMKARRRRRRKMRRYKRTEQEARKYYDNDNYDRDEAGNGKLYRRSRKNSDYLKKYRYRR